MDSVDPEGLPPFSFSKKPIRSFMPTLLFSLILKLTSPDKRPVHKPSLNNINYDEQIRAPRMSAASHYTYTPEAPRPFAEKSRPLLSESIAPLPAPEPLGAAYRPAIVDLRPARRSLEPLRGLIPNLMLGAELAALLEQLKLLRAIDNLSSNTTSAERTENDPDSTHEGEQELEPAPASRTGTRVFADGPLQQVYDLKKPLCMPAVLRPSADEPDAVSVDDVMGAVLAVGLPETQLLAGQTEPVEPTHEHWKPDSSTDHCMKCFEVFGSFFVPRRRRHHCRFCGMLFCQSCLYKGQEATYDTVPGKGLRRADSSLLTASHDEHGGVLMDARARLAVPLLRNLDPEASHPYKACKACKSCGQNYQRLVVVLNQTRTDVTSPYVFIDNPYLAPTAPVVRLDKPERRLSTNNVPSDWTWSSF